MVYIVLFCLIISINYSFFCFFSFDLIEINMTKPYIPKSIIAPSQSDILEMMAWNHTPIVPYCVYLPFSLRGKV